MALALAFFASFYLKTDDFWIVSLTVDQRPYRRQCIRIVELMSVDPFWIFLK